MKQGDRVTCLHCGEKTFVKAENIMSGWQVTGKKFVCALCGGNLDSPENESAVKASSSARDKLAALLGGDDVKKVVIDPGEDFRRGCRNCGHLLEHPFKLLCALTQQEVDPMHECSNFIDREQKKE
jgi:DNA-directed RNA polymerase subunit RPC12/RpoP